MCIRFILWIGRVIQQLNSIFVASQERRRYLQGQRLRSSLDVIVLVCKQYVSHSLLDGVSDGHCPCRAHVHFNVPRVSLDGLIDTLIIIFGRFKHIQKVPNKMATRESLVLTFMSYEHDLEHH